MAYRWSFGDGSTAEGANVVHQYSADGTYLVGLTVTDDDGLESTDLLIVDARAEAVVAADEYSTGANTALSVNAAAGVLANDSDVVDSEAYVVVEPEHGVLELALDGSFVYTPDAGFVGADTFTYAHASERTAVARGIVTIDVIESDPPVTALEDRAATTEDVAVEVDVLSNDIYESAAVEIESVEQPANGTTDLVAGLVRYTPQADFFGLDEFRYTICDIDGPCSSALVMLTIDPVNDAPLVVDDDVSTFEDAPVEFDPLMNDTDVDDTELVVSDVGVASNGKVEITAGGVTYSPADDWCGSDSFSYTVADPDGETGSAMVAVEVECVNDPPVAVDDGFETDEDVSLTLDAPGVLGNDSDVDGDVLSVVDFDAASTGELTVNPDGSLEYLPAPNSSGIDSFTYEVCDTSSLCDTATVDGQRACRERCSGREERQRHHDTRDTRHHRRARQRHRRREHEAHLVRRRGPAGEGNRSRSLRRVDPVHGEPGPVRYRHLHLHRF